MLTCSLSSQSRITCNDPVVVLNVRVWLLRPPRGPGTRTQTVAESFPTSRPATRSNMTSIPSPFPRLRRLSPHHVGPEGPLPGHRPPRHTPKRARPHQCVSTSPADPQFSSASAATRRAQPITPDAPPEVAWVGLTARAECTPFWSGVTMSIHKLTAGSGYDYLTRQVAALDATEKGHTGLASYYTERAETSGVWIGSGMGGIDGLTAGDPVTAEQMRALFGCGLHPLAELRQQQLAGPDLTPRDYQDAARLGVPFRIVDNDLRPFRVEVAKRIAALKTAIGGPADASIASADRARVR